MNAPEDFNELALSYYLLWLSTKRFNYSHPYNEKMDDYGMMMMMQWVVLSEGGHASLYLLLKQVHRDAKLPIPLIPPIPPIHLIPSHRCSYTHTVRTVRLVLITVAYYLLPIAYCLLPASHLHPYTAT